MVAERPSAISTPPGTRASNVCPPPPRPPQDFITESEAAASRLAAEPRAATTPAAKPAGAPLHLLGLAALVVAGFLAGAARKGKPLSSGKPKALAERVSHGALV